jgi:hypothetical protein
MKTLYAFILVCLSVPAFANELDFEGAFRDDPYSAWTTLPATPQIEDYSIDTGVDFYVDEHDHTAAVAAPVTPPIEDYSIDTDVEFHLGDDGWNFKLPETSDLDSSQASDWY